MSCTRPGCIEPACADLDNEKCYHEVCGECGNSTAAIGEQIAQAYRDGLSDGLYHFRARN